jgi:hypothetical protein
MKYFTNGDFFLNFPPLSELRQLVEHDALSYMEAIIARWNYIGDRDGSFVWWYSAQILRSSSPR